MEHGVRNSLLVAPMPTASTSQILGNNECFEPYTSNIYTRRVLSGQFMVVNKHLLKDLIDLGLWSEEMKNAIIANNGSIQSIEGIPQEIKELYKTAWEIKQRSIIDMAADRGAFIDITLDFAFYALVPVGFALADPDANALAAAVLIAAFVGTGSSFLAFAAVAARHGRTATAFPTKGIHYLGGLTEGFETIVVFGAMCLIPAAFAGLAFVFSAACAVTTVLRWRQGWTAFAVPGQDRHSL
jgi:hypothetical protein